VDRVRQPTGRLVLAMGGACATAALGLLIILLRIFLK
jgi:hypothetical protein